MWKLLATGQQTFVYASFVAELKSIRDSLRKKKESATSTMLRNHPRLFTRGTIAPASNADAVTLKSAPPQVSPNLCPD